MQESRAVAEKPHDAVVQLDRPTYRNLKFTAASRGSPLDSTALVIYLYAFQRYRVFSLLCCSTTLFPNPTSSLRQIFPCSPGIRWMAFGGYEERRRWANCPCN